MKVVVTGCAGFIGAAVCDALLKSGHSVFGVDDFNDYYKPALKRRRVESLVGNGEFKLFEVDVSDTNAIEKVFAAVTPQRVIHLAAQAGIRRALNDPHSYGRTNLIGFLNVIEASAKLKVEHFVFASTSSVYGLNALTPFVESHAATHPISLYSATKVANEAIAHSYSATHGLACTGLRFFTVYGPWGRPDMAPIKFAKSIIQGHPIQIYNNGRHSRDFTYIDDIVRGVLSAVNLVAKPEKDFNPVSPDPGSSNTPWRVFNIGGENPIALMDFVAKLESALGRKAKIEFVARQIGDMETTSADCSALRDATGWTSKVSLEEGLKNLAGWCEANLDLI